VEEDGWDALAHDAAPDGQIEQKELLAAVRTAVDDALTAHQRRVFVALALNEVPVDVLAERLGTTRGALYKTLHEARGRLRAALAGRGLGLDAWQAPPTTAARAPRRSIRLAFVVLVGELVQLFVWLLTGHSSASPGFVDVDPGQLSGGEGREDNPDPEHHTADHVREPVNLQVGAAPSHACDPECGETPPGCPSMRRCKEQNECDACDRPIRGVPRGERRANRVDKAVGRAWSANDRFKRGRQKRRERLGDQEGDEGGEPPSDE
jgi:hypothetical protein